MIQLSYGDKMKRNLLLISVSIIFGILFTYFILNKEDIYAKEEYYIYAFQAGAFEDIDNANKYSDKLPASIIINENNLYKVYVAIYKDIDIINEMVVYFENNNINIYLKGIKVNKDFYEILDSYEQIIKNSDKNIYNKINQSILNSYLESDKND